MESQTDTFFFHFAFHLSRKLCGVNKGVVRPVKAFFLLAAWAIKLQHCRLPVFMLEHLLHAFYKDKTKQSQVKQGAEI